MESVARSVAPSEGNGSCQVESSNWGQSLSSDTSLDEIRATDSVTSLKSCRARRSYDQRLLINYVCLVQDIELTLT